MYGSRYSGSIEPITDCGMNTMFKWSEEDRAWFARMSAKQGIRGDALRMDGKLIGESTVNGMLAATQWSYNANKSTRPKTVARVARKRAAVAPAGELVALRSRVAELESQLDAAERQVSHLQRRLFVQTGAKVAAR